MTLMRETGHFFGFFLVERKAEDINIYRMVRNNGDKLSGIVELNQSSNLKVECNSEDMTFTGRMRYIG